jgi:ELWxxDGT repeat protein
VLFAATDAIYGLEPWVTDGTARLADINPGTGGSLPRFTSLGNGTAVFSAYDPAHGSELWVTDGTAAGTALIADIRPGPGSSLQTFFAPPPFAALGDGRVLFGANDGTHGSELWVSDGTAAGTALVADSNPARSVFTRAI